MSDIEKFVDDVLIKLWNDIANRQAGKVIFKESRDILETRKLLLEEPTK